MKKSLILAICLMIFLVCTGFTVQTEDDFEKQYISTEYNVCSNSSSKTYMGYKSINDRSSTQYKFIKEEMTINTTSGLLEDSEGFIGVALGSNFGEIGTRYYFTLSSGVVLPLIKIEQKASVDTVDGCQHISDSSVIEFVVDKEIASDYFGVYNNGYILGGNFNNDDRFNGTIEKIELVTEELVSGVLFKPHHLELNVKK